ncbi:hypothetical protein PG999_003127 [Apiospora kogelbergensis]|uniref:Uncharacterized protein n=1 Tax=Apiospora kogelbergensis TaxID=1337665 RepID=A0AAW0RA22_9PEZI
MSDASDRAVYSGETPHKHPHAVARQATEAPSRAAMSRDKVNEYLENDDGNPVAGMSSQSASNRQARINSEVTRPSLAQLEEATS